MSMFYLTPVKGDMPVHLLEKIVTARLVYLKSIYRENFTVYNEYVVEGSLYDNVGHFMLCIVTILGRNTGFTQFFLKAEKNLFERRLESLSSYDMRCFAKKLLRSINKYEKILSFLDPLQVLCRHLMLKDIAQHICSSTHSRNCSVHNIHLNFKHCLSFIAKRQVELANGVAYVPCGKWKDYLLQLFSQNLKYRVSKTDLTPLKSDPRIMEFLTKFKREMFPITNNNCNSNVLFSKDVDRRSRFFPPCMLNLHQSLRSKHRLSHSQRFYYSLFLKDIGMPIEEAIDFWRLEYRQSPSGHHSCCHNWERDEKKYLYGIRHMYGLEGARKNYTSVNCSRIQSESSCSEGGCPFKSFDQPKMMQLLPNTSPDIQAQINELKKRHQYTSACVIYLQNSSQNSCDNLSFNFTPVKYYMTASKNDLMNL